MSLKYFYQYDVEDLILTKKYKELYALMTNNNQLITDKYVSSDTSLSTSIYIVHVSSCSYPCSCKKTN